MARMHPARLSDRVLNSRLLKGEVQTYEALAKLPDEFEVFYNRHVSQGQGARAHVRRIDFIIIHEKLGLLAVEVKGGKVRIGNDGSFEHYHPSSKSWASADPFRQVEIATIELIQTCKADGANYWIPDDICVVFPNTLRTDLTNLPHLLPDGLLCKDDLPLLTTVVPRMFSKPKKGQVWRREDFLDMRRRLQNFAEAHRGGVNLGGKRQKKKTGRSADYSPSKESALEDVYDDIYGYAGDVRAAAYVSKSPRYVIASRKSTTPAYEKRRLKWWEACVALATLIAAYLIVSWLFPNSIVQNFF